MEREDILYVFSAIEDALNAIAREIEAGSSVERELVYLRIAIKNCETSGLN